MLNDLAEKIFSIGLMKAGELTTHESGGSGAWRDTTAEDIERLEREIAAERAQIKMQTLRPR